MESEVKLSALKVSQKLNISTKTLNNWYRFWEDETTEKPKGIPELPAYQRINDNMRIWDVKDIPQLRKFKNWIPKGRNGIMGKTNARYFSGRGKYRPESKKEDNNG